MPQKREKHKSNFQYPEIRIFLFYKERTEASRANVP